MKLPDQFYDAARERIATMLSDHPKLGAAVTLAEGAKFISAVALEVTSLYRKETQPE